MLHLGGPFGTYVDDLMEVLTHLATHVWMEEGVLAYVIHLRVELPSLGDLFGTFGIYFLGLVGV